MLCLGIEGTAHTIGVGIVDENCNILANESKMFFGKEGIHPREAANHHALFLPDLIKSAVKKAKIEFKDLDLIAFSQGPGLGPCLRTSATASRTLSLILKIPIIGVNHCIAHLEIGRNTCNCKDPMMLYVSGGNTQVVGFANGRYRVFGETLDIGIGNALDKFGREIGLKFPAGAEIEKIAKRGKYIELPYSIKGMDVSFSGILTSCLNLVKKEKLNDICFSLQETTFAMLTEVLERAVAHADKDEILLTGGVARNKRLQEMVKKMADERNAKFFVPKDEFCIDNGVMIAYLGILMHLSGERMKIEETEIKQKFRTDDVEVKWRQ